MQQRHSINKGGERNWINAHKNKNIVGVKTPIFGKEFGKAKFCGYEVIDEAADKQMSGGWNKNNKKCDRCFVLKSTSGKCGCE